MVAAVVLIRARRDAIQGAARQVADIDGVAEVYSVSGEWDLIAVVRVPEWEQIAEVVTEHIARVEGLERTETLVAFRVYSRTDLDAAYEMFD
jgi:DNA-binding Lrp family transcriptional regulator